MQATPDSDYSVLAKSQRIDELWPQLAAAVAKNSESGLSDRIAREISSTPGLSTDVHAQARTAIPSIATAAREELTQQLAATGGAEFLDHLVLTVYPKYITPAEASTLASFYRSAPGAKMLRLTPTMMAERKVNSAADPIGKYFNPAEIEALSAFARHPAAQKINAVAPQVRQEMRRYFADRTEPLFAALARKYAAKLIALAAANR